MFPGFMLALRGAKHLINDHYENKKQQIAEEMYEFYISERQKLDEWAEKLDGNAEYFNGWKEYLEGYEKQPGADVKLLEKRYRELDEAIAKHNMDIKELDAAYETLDRQYKEAMRQGGFRV